MLAAVDLSNAICKLLSIDWEVGWSNSFVMSVLGHSILYGLYIPSLGRTHAPLYTVPWVNRTLCRWIDAIMAIFIGSFHCITLRDSFHCPDSAVMIFWYSVLSLSNLVFSDTNWAIC